MPVQTMHRFTVAEYHRMVEVGLLKPDARVELLDGQIVDMMPIGPFHGGINKRLVRLFTQIARERWIVAVQVIEVYREPHFTGYASPIKLRAGAAACPQAFPDVAVDVAALLRQAG